VPANCTSSYQTETRRSGVTVVSPPRDINGIEFGRKRIQRIRQPGRDRKGDNKRAELFNCTFECVSVMAENQSATGEPDRRGRSQYGAARWFRVDSRASGAGADNTCWLSPSPRTGVSSASLHWTGDRTERTIIAVRCVALQPKT